MSLNYLDPEFPLFYLSIIYLYLLRWRKTEFPIVDVLCTDDMNGSPRRWWWWFSPCWSSSCCPRSSTPMTPRWERYGSLHGSNRPHAGLAVVQYITFNHVTAAFIQCGWKHSKHSIKIRSSYKKMYSTAQPIFKPISQNQKNNTGTFFPLHELRTHAVSHPVVQVILTDWIHNTYHLYILEWSQLITILFASCFAFVFYSYGEVCYCNCVNAFATVLMVL